MQLNRVFTYNVIIAGRFVIVFWIFTSGVKYFTTVVSKIIMNNFLKQNVVSFTI